MFILLGDHPHQPSPEHLISCQTETLHPVNSNSQLSPPLSPWHSPRHHLLSLPPIVCAGSFRQLGYPAAARASRERQAGRRARGSAEVCTHSDSMSHRSSAGGAVPRPLPLKQPWTRGAPVNLSKAAWPCEVGEDRGPADPERQPCTVATEAVSLQTGRSRHRD